MRCGRQRAGEHRLYAGARETALRVLKITARDYVCGTGKKVKAETSIIVGCVLIELKR